jgi:hypothetical protein
MLLIVFSFVLNLNLKKNSKMISFDVIYRLQKRK